MDEVNSAIDISEGSKSSFFYAFNLLPKPKRDAMNAVYAFCRKTDDIIDEGNEPDEIKYERLRKWRIEFEKSISGNSSYPLLNKVADIIKQFNIPIEPFFELIIGMEMDLQNKRYLSFDDLVKYCYRVASTVGLMCIEIFGYKNKSTIDYAVNLGLALQMTNILRDVKVDAEKNRIYLPQEDLLETGYTEQDLFANVYNDKFIELMKKNANRAHNYFEKADYYLDPKDKSGLFPARAMQHIYYSLLKKIEKKNYDVYSQKISVSKLEKVYLAFGVWAKYSLIY
ncbi:MAG TPA: presqualene diphosphate synthase HpnD [Melioribacteraceae bacterium]|nr:presqualene diphosphate synthase HpnD [Melioribacteraceae bacterium]